MCHRSSQTTRTWIIRISLPRVHTAKVLTYLKLGNYKLGLLLNFNVTTLKNGIKRVIKKYITSKKELTNKSMISILIPVFNFNITALVKSIANQAINSKISFEIICLDDASTLLELVYENLKINEIKNCQYIISPENRGRTATRNELAKKAKYDNLLFLDADVLPANSTFLKQYITCLNDGFDAVFGGYAYRQEDLKVENTLRWNYGIKREQKDAGLRNQNKYGHVFSGNFMMKKNDFLNLKIPELKVYGLDIYFAFLLLKSKKSVLHIDNPIFHLGLETNQVFFEKSLQSVENRKEMLVHLEETELLSPMISTFKKLEQWNLVFVFKMFFKISKPFLKNQIFKSKPNLTAFDLYRLGYLCEISKE